MRWRRGVPRNPARSACSCRRPAARLLGRRRRPPSPPKSPGRPPLRWLPARPPRCGRRAAAGAHGLVWCPSSRSSPRWWWRCKTGGWRRGALRSRADRGCSCPRRPGVRPGPGRSQPSRPRSPRTSPRTTSPALRAGGCPAAAAVAAARWSRVRGPPQRPGGPVFGTTAGSRQRPPRSRSAAGLSCRRRRGAGRGPDRSQPSRPRSPRRRQRTSGQRAGNGRCPA
jgi:hypothetical protein